MKITTQHFGTTATAYTMENQNGTSVTVLDYGASIQSIRFHGTELVLGYDDASGYERGSAYFGATIGRTCNRIAGASFVLNKATYRLAQNDGRNQHHGGICGFDKRIWNVHTASDAIVCSRISPDGEEGYPGNLEVSVTFRLTDDDTLHICYDATTDAETIVNLTNHSYFNLNGSGSALDHILWAPADYYVENNAESIPTGRILPVAGTPFDFRTPKKLGQDIDTPCIQLTQAEGYDHTLLCQEATASANGIRLHVKTDRPGIHLYSANYLHEVGRAVYPPRSAVCFETQLFTDAIHHPNFASPILRAGEHLHTETSYQFSHIL